MNPLTAPRIELTEEQQRDPVILQELRELDASLAANPLYTYKPNPKQDAFHRAKVRTRCFLGGNRSGKTTASIIDCLIQAIDEDKVPEHLIPFKRFKPPFRCRIVMPDFTRTFRAIEETIRQWCPPAQLKGGAWEDAFQKKEFVVSFENGSFIECLSYEQPRSKHGGVTRDRVVFDEEPDGERGFEIWEENHMRLMESGGDELFSFTPFQGLSWLFDRFEEERGPEIAKNVWLDEKLLVVRASVRENPVITERKIEEYMEGIPEHLRRAREDGEFVHFKGLVYPMFDPDIHCVDDGWLRSDAGKDHIRRLDLYEVIDPGYNTTCVLFAGFDPDNRLLIYDELYLSGVGSIPENAAERIREKRRWWGTEPMCTYIDPSARNHTLTGRKDPNSGVVTPDTVEAAYYRAGIRTLRANNDKEGGVFEVMRRLENKDLKGEPDPLILFGRNCVGLTRETRRYRLKPKEDGSFDVLKKEDHGPDCARYLCNARPLSPAKPLSRVQRTNKGWAQGTAPAASLNSVPDLVGPLGRFT